MTTKFNIFPFPNLTPTILTTIRYPSTHSLDKFRKVLKDYNLSTFTVPISIEEAETLDTTSSHIVVIKPEPFDAGFSYQMLFGKDSLFLEDIIGLSDEERELLACELFIRSMA